MNWNLSHLLSVCLICLLSRFHNAPTPPWLCFILRGKGLLSAHSVSSTVVVLQKYKNAQMRFKWSPDSSHPADTFLGICLHLLDKKRCFSVCLSAPQQSVADFMARVCPSPLHKVCLQRKSNPCIHEHTLRRIVLFKSCCFRVYPAGQNRAAPLFT